MIHKGKDCVFCKGVADDHPLVKNLEEQLKDLKELICQAKWTEKCNENNNSLYLEFENKYEALLKKWSEVKWKML